MTDSAERSWQQWGKEDPFFGVLSDPKFLKANLNEETREEFFRSGEEHIDEVFQTIENKVRAGFQPRRAIDFGCGVGRLVIPLAKRTEEAVGIDVSAGMLAEAEKNCSQRGISNARLMNVHEIDSLSPSSFDLVHSFIVFQHIPVPKGETLIRKLISLLAVEGVGVIHVTFADTRPALNRAVSAIRTRSGVAHGLLNVAQRRRFSRPLMEMNSYSLNRIFNMLFEAHCANVHVEFTYHSAHRGAILYFEKLSG